MALKHLALVCFEDPRAVSGGVQRRLSAEIAYFSARGVRVTVLCAGSEETVVEGRVSYVSLAVPSVPYPLQTLVFALRARRWLFAQGVDVDVIETHHDAGLTLLFGRSHSARWVQVVHGVFRDEWNAIRHSEPLFSRNVLQASGLWALAWIEQAAVHQADAVLAVSQYAAHAIEHLYGLSAMQVNIIPNGIDTQTYRPASLPTSFTEAIEVLYVGRWHARKGVRVLVEAFAQAYHRYPNLHLTLVGGGPQAAELRALCATLHLEQAITFAGRLSDSEIVARYQQAAIVCLPSLQEGQGIVALEAQACGAPIIATIVGGLPEAVRPGVTGLLVSANNVNHLVWALEFLAGAPDLRALLSHQAIQWAQTFNWEWLLSQQATLYDRLTMSPQPATSLTTIGANHAPRTYPH